LDSKQQLKGTINQCGTRWKRYRGAIGINRIVEKDVILQLANEILRLNKGHGDLEIYLTRYPYSPQKKKWNKATYQKSLETTHGPQFG